MDSFNNITKLVKEKMANPKVVLLNNNKLRNPTVFHRKNILSTQKMSKYLYILYSPQPLYVSTVFNKEFSFKEDDFEYFTARKCLDSIYYDLEIKR